MNNASPLRIWGKNANKNDRIIAKMVNRFRDAQKTRQEAPGREILTN
jgi:hypothetical protein